MSRRSICLMTLGFSLVIFTWIAWSWAFHRGSEGRETSTAEAPDPVPSATHEAPHPVHIRTLRDARWLDSGEKDENGQPILVRCNTCHQGRPPKNRTSAADLKEFHTGRNFRHGDLSCHSCHNPADYETLRLADGRIVPFTNSMDLCKQCHGPQHRDYMKGVHGGMTGFWDLSRGPRQRNHCIDCHNPHAPTFPRVAPTFHPRDRFPPAGH